MTDAYNAQRKAQSQTTNLAHMSHLDIYSDPHNYRKTSIICTIGPKTNSVERLSALFKAGMSVVRMNFSHGSHEYHKSVIDNARAAEKSIPDAVFAIALDTKGPEIRTGLLKDDEITLSINDEFLFTTDPKRAEDGDKDAVYVDYTNITKVMKPGQIIFVDDGLLSLEVLKVEENGLRVRVVNAGKLGSRKGVNLPDVNVDLPALSVKDKGDLAFGVEQGVDMVFASFIRKKSDVEEVRAVLGEKGKGIKIISKIENHEGVRNFDEILQASDGIMVARGDLGIEIPAQKVFLAQKMMIAKCNIAGKPVICATQMLESMTYNPRPTRAEVSDVANAVLDGSDCVMLSGESAKGNYPIEAVSMMASICREAESAMSYTTLFNELRLHQDHPTSMAETIASSAVNACFEHHGAAIVVLTTTGTTARLVAKYRPTVPIFTVTRHPHTARVAHLYRGCHPIIVPARAGDSNWQSDVDNRIDCAVQFGVKRGMLKPGQTVICIQGWEGGAGKTNTMRMVVVK